MKILLTKAKMTKYKVYDLSFYFDTSYKKTSHSMILENPKFPKKKSINNLSFDDIL